MSAEHKHDSPAHHIVGIKTYAINLLALMALMLLTVAAYEFVHINHTVNLIIALTIAIAKMMCIILIFMHVRWSSRLTWVFVGAGFLWFLIMVTFTVADYATRYWHSPFTVGPYGG